MFVKVLFSIKIEVGDRFVIMFFTQFDKINIRKVMSKVHKQKNNIQSDEPDAKVNTICVKEEIWGLLLPIYHNYNTLLHVLTKYRIYSYIK